MLIREDMHKPYTVKYYQYAHLQMGIRSKACQFFMNMQHSLHTNMRDFKSNKNSTFFFSFSFYTDDEGQLLLAVFKGAATEEGATSEDMKPHIIITRRERWRVVMVGGGGGHTNRDRPTERLRET